MLWSIIKPFVPYLISAAIAGISTLIVRGKNKKIDEQKGYVKNLQHQLAAEVMRNQEKQNQIDDLLNFRKEDDERAKEMDAHAEILRKAKTKEEVKDELKKVSDNIRNIFNS